MGSKQMNSNGAIVSMPLISVIVPVYNVEKYLAFCIKSISEQTYEKLEIILVDDGSTDNSGAICDDCAKADDRIVVVHKQNGGSSAARNEGLRRAKGDYVGFVDADDWLMSDAYEYLLSLVQVHSADGAQMACARVFDENDKHAIPSESISVYEGKAILQDFMASSTVSGSYSMCTCLLNAHVVQGLLFREGKINEDIDYKYIALSRCERFVVSNQIKYFYRQGRYTTNSTGGLKQADFDLYEAADLLYELACGEAYGDIAHLALVKKARTPLSLLCKIAYYGISDEAIDKHETTAKLKRELRQSCVMLLRSPMPLSRKALTALFCVNYSATEMLVHVAQRLGM